MKKEWNCQIYFSGIIVYLSLLITKEPALKTLKLSLNFSMVSIFFIFNGVKINNVYEN